ATLLQVDPGTWERTVYARGLRNMIGFDWEPETGQLYGMDNGGDTKGDDFPPEELNRIVKNMDYGWPLVYGKRVVDKTREDPAGTSKDAYAKRTQPSVMEFPAHMAPIAFQFFKNTNSASLPE